MVLREQLLQPRELLADQDLNDSLINSSAGHVLKVIDWHQILDQTCECPERLFLGHHLQQAANDEIEALAVPDMYITI